MNKEERIQYVLDNIKDNIAVNIALSLVEECDELLQELDKKNKIIEEIKRDLLELTKQGTACINYVAIYNEVYKIEELEKCDSNE